MRRPSRRWATRLGALLLFGAMVLGLAGAELSVQASSRHDVLQRFQDRTAAAAGFLQSYTTYTLDRERTAAQHLLAGPAVSQQQFEQFLNIFGFGPAVLLDGSGRDLAVTPYDPAVVGTDLAGRYAHLASALAGRPAVSDVVSSAAQHVPVVAFATSFPTPYGNRVVSGAFDLSSQPIGSYLQHALPYSDGTVYLLDSAGRVISSNTGAPLPRSLLPGVAAGTFRSPSGAESEYSQVAVPSTPWRLVFTVPEDALFEPISRLSQTVPWILLGGFALATAGLLVMLVRALEAKARSDTAARTDPLTQIANRRGATEVLDRLISDRRRYGTPFGALLVDVDHFKAVNDRFGHAAGDHVLKEVAGRVSGCLRTGDEVARWGGEEFLVLLPHADGSDVAAVAERVRRSVSSTPVQLDGSPERLTVSMGGTTADELDDATLLIGRADAALYVAKDSGRDRAVVVADDLVGTP